MVNIVIKGITNGIFDFYTVEVKNTICNSVESTVINSNGNMKELERKIKCEKLMFR